MEHEIHACNVRQLAWWGVAQQQPTVGPWPHPGQVMRAARRGRMRN